MEINNNIRHLARFIIEAQVPIVVGSGESDIITDKLVMTDLNGLPFIPGTTLAGIVRSFCKKELFGSTESGSLIIFSSAHFIGEEGKVIEGMIDTRSEFYNRMLNLPVRQHVKIGSNGAPERGALFDEEVVYMGARFCFEIEFWGNEDDFDEILNVFYSDNFRIGGGTRSGYGKIRVVECKKCSINVSDDLYINKSSSLNDQFWNKSTVMKFNGRKTSDLNKREILLTPEHFFSIGEVPMTETRIVHKNDGTSKFDDKTYALIPASSIKGVLAHRTAFYYNKIAKVTLDKISDYEEHVGIKNKAVKELFGTTEQPGKVMIDDCLVEMPDNAKFIQPHVAIDAFTGGARPGALFKKQQIYCKEIKLNIYVHQSVSHEAKVAFDSAVEDLMHGRLQIGSKVTNGLGVMRTTKTFQNGK